MGDIYADGGVSSYPTDLDTRTAQVDGTPTLPFGTTVISASKLNEVADAVIAVQTKVGTTTTTGTAGSVIFSGGANFAQDNANLFWDDSANKLRIGTGTTSGFLNIQQSADITAGTPSTYALTLFDGTNVTLAFGYDASFSYMQSFAGRPLQINNQGNNVFIGGSTNNFGIGTNTFGTSAASVLGIINGTAPTTGPADSVQFYSTDDAAGHTIPSFFCEGTNVLATGQADSASSVRVKMRINGTVVTLLAI